MKHWHWTEWLLWSWIALGYIGVGALLLWSLLQGRPSC